MKELFICSLMVLSVFSWSRTSLCQASDLPALTLSDKTWKLEKGMSIANEILTIKGNPDVYRKATITVPALAFAEREFYFCVEVKLNDIVPGHAMYMRPKIKIYQNGDQPYQARNISGIAEGRWSRVTLLYKLKSGQNPQTLMFELAVQHCSGTAQFRNPLVQRDKPRIAFSYPFSKPKEPVCKLDIDTSVSRAMNNNLLGVNQQFVWSEMGYGDQAVDDLIAKIDLPHLRFPAGTVANFYDWQADGLSIPPGYQGRCLKWLKPRIQAEVRFGFEAYAKLCRSQQITSELTFNIMEDSVTKSVRRLAHRKQAGLNITYIEMGNENSYPNQAGGQVPDVEAYIALTRKLSKALKAVDPSVKTAVNIEGNMTQWDLTLAAENYYDAVVMHPYLSINTAIGDDETVASLLSAYKQFNFKIQNYLSVFGNRDLVLSEWGLICNDKQEAGTETIFAALAIADTFLAILEQSEDGPVREACLHMFMGISDKPIPGPTLLFNYNPKTQELLQSRRGVVFRNIISTFRDSQVYISKSVADELIAGLPSVIARAVKRSDGTVVIFAVNKLDEPCPIQIAINGQVYKAGYIRKSYTESTLTGTAWYPIDEPVMKIQQGIGVNMLPPLSVNVIELLEVEKP